MVVIGGIIFIRFYNTIDTKNKISSINNLSKINTFSHITKVDSIEEITFDTIIKSIPKSQIKLTKNITNKKLFTLDTILNKDTIKIELHSDSILKLNISFYSDTFQIINKNTREIKLIELTPIRIENNENTLLEDIEYYIGILGIGIILGMVLE